MITRPGVSPPAFSHPCFGFILAQWTAWKQGICPSSEPRGYAGQNPDLLAAFDALSRAESRAHEHWRKNPPK